jgi:D-serine deaminase-like pyridoxal phosphate-dependent protein
MEYKDQWYTINNAHEVTSPSLLVYPERIKSNIKRMIGIAGGAERLRPHVKTHKTPQVIKMQMDLGISRFKCATISEIEMAAGCGAGDMLLAMQPVGPNLERLFRLREAFPQALISCIVDSEQVALQLSDLSLQNGKETAVYIDLNNGMNRSGILPGEDAVRLALKITGLPMVTLRGLHVYDGHIRETDFARRRQICNESFRPVDELVERLKDNGIRDLKIIAGGTSTFPVHAMRKGVECSPGTTLLWDYGYSSSFPDIDLLHAAVLFTRVISKPGKGLLSLDLGHKAVASEMPHPRVMFPGIGNYELVNHSEEHMVLKTPLAENLTIGEVLYGIPWHICPTVDRFDSLYVVNDSKVETQWMVAARTRKITI